MLYLHTRKLGLDFWLCFFFSSAYLFLPYCPLLQRKKLCSVMVLFGFFFYTVFVTLAETVACGQIDAIFLRKRTSVKRKALIRSSFPY